MSFYQRTRMVLGDEGVARLQKASVAVFGIGGVGSFTAEALARAGVGRLILVDNDVVSQSNINRQLIALQSTVGQLKVEVMATRIADINPSARVETYPLFYTADTAEQVPMDGWDYIVDAIDTVSSKLLLVERAKAAGIPIISSMGTGNKLDPTRFEVADISKTSVCPLARVMRYELRKRGISHLKVIYSKELPRTPLESGEQTPGRRQTPGSLAFVPSVAGLIAAGEVIRDLAQIKAE